MTAQVNLPDAPVNHTYFIKARSSDVEHEVLLTCDKEINRACATRIMSALYGTVQSVEVKADDVF